MSEEMNEEVVVEEAVMAEDALEISPSLIEAIVFAHGEPVSIGKIVELSRSDEDAVLVSIELLKERYNGAEFGIELVEVNGQFQFRTKNTYADILRELKQEKPKRLSIAALETLAIIAYRQPIVKSDIERIRGVDATPTIKTLLDRKLVRIVGHQSTVGQPALYGTTDDFMKLFGLGSLSELPTLRDLTELDRDPGETGEEAPEEMVESAANDDLPEETAAEAV